MLDAHLVALFLPFALILVVTPGPDTINVLALSLARGRIAGLRSVAGHALSSVIHLTAAALGLSAIIATSAAAFTVLKWIGAIYLVYLGVRALISSPRALQEVQPESSRSDFWQGFTTHLTNPKVAIFYITVLPQFVNPHLGNVGLQTFLLGAIQKSMAFVWLLSVSFAAIRARSWLAKHPGFLTWQQRVCGLFFVGFGLKLALAKQRG